MTINECLRINGLQVACEITKTSRYGNIDIDFEVNGMIDETQFSVQNPLSTDCKKELSKLFDNFCKENSLPKNTVISITIVQLANTIEELD